jgi:hypothetical protein
MRGPRSCAVLAQRGRSSRALVRYLPQQVSGQFRERRYSLGISLLLFGIQFGDHTACNGDIIAHYTSEDLPHDCRDKAACKAVADV